MVYVVMAVFALLRNGIVFYTGVRALNERHPSAYTGELQYIKDMLDLRKWTYKQFYK